MQLAQHHDTGRVGRGQLPGRLQRIPRRLLLASLRLAITHLHIALTNRLSRSSRFLCLRLCCRTVGHHLLHRLLQLPPLGPLRLQSATACGGAATPAPVTRGGARKMGDPARNAHAQHTVPPRCHCS
jgi:hypothetical protein